jgi:hypothetical protein
LALLEPSTKSFWKVWRRSSSRSIPWSAIVGGVAVEPTGALAVTEGLVTTVQMMHYPVDVDNFSPIGWHCCGT